MSKLLSPGEFAKLARTTKRTVLFYDEKEIIKPFKLDKSGYRWYKSSQIIDFQVILLLRKLNFSLEDIKAYLYKENSLKKLFRSQKEILKREIVSLQLSLKNITKYYRNLEATGTLVKPKIKKIKPLSIYYIYKEAAYADIKDICFELKNMFEFIPEGAKYLVIYMKNGYSPKKAAMKIGVIATEDMIIKKEYYSMIKMERIDAYKTLSYMHSGSGALLSLLWKGLEKYFRKHKYQVDPKLPFGLEIYHLTSLNGEMEEDRHRFEIQIPVIR